MHTYQLAKTHGDYIEETLSSFGKTINNVYFFLVGGKIPSSSRIAGLFQKVSIVCHSHRLNVGVATWLTRFEQVLKQLTTYMNKFNNVHVANQLIQKQNLLKKTNKKTVGRDESSWTSTLNMLIRYREIQAEMSLVAHDNPRLLTNVQALVDQRVSATLTMLSIDLEFIREVKSTIQSDQFHYVGVKNALKRLETHYAAEADFVQIISQSSDLVMDKEFETGLYKAMRGETLEDAEKRQLQVFKTKVIQPVSQGNVTGELTSHERVLEGILAANIDLKEEQRRNSAVYDDLTWIPATTHRIKRLFPVARLVVTQQRTRLSKKLFDCFLFLREHMDLWDVTGHEMEAAVSKRRVLACRLLGRENVSDDDLFEENEVDEAGIEELEEFAAGMNAFY